MDKYVKIGFIGIAFFIVSYIFSFTLLYVVTTTWLVAIFFALSLTVLLIERRISYGGADYR